MLSQPQFLVIASNINALQLEPYFVKLGYKLGLADVSFLLMDPKSKLVFNNFHNQRIFHKKEMIYADQEKNKITSQQENFRSIAIFVNRLKKFIYKDTLFVKSKDLNLNMAAEEAWVSKIKSTAEVYEKSAVVDLKFDSVKKNIQLEIKNKGIKAFDHLFIEKTDSCLSYLKDFDKKAVVKKEASDLVWICYKFKLSNFFTSDEFWLIENADYHSFFDNSFYIQPNFNQISGQQELLVWVLIPDHQILNQQFHNEYQMRIKSKVENKIDFITLSFDGVMPSVAHFGDSQKSSLNSKSRISGFPCFSFIPEEDRKIWFAQFEKYFYKKHKVKKDQPT